MIISSTHLYSLGHYYHIHYCYTKDVKKKKNIVRVAAVDTLGVILIIISPLVGWLPGPGGIPLFLAGLSLLASNHAWAKRLQNKLLQQTKSSMQKLFQEHPTLQALYDLISAIFIIIGIYLINTYTKNITLTFAIFLLLTASALFLGNRKRLERLIRLIKR
jgi:uncharacterized membrane protein